MSKLHRIFPVAGILLLALTALNKTRLPAPRRPPNGGSAAQGRHKTTPPPPLRYGPAGGGTGGASRRTAARAVLLGVLTALAWGCSAPQKPVAPTQTAIPATPTAAVQMPAQHEWILVDLPANATQLEYGAEVYRLVCQDCHGDRGQGLTPEWRMTWAPQDRNCWQSKCHAANHPQDGFTLPAVPPVVGPATMARFATALDLHDFIQAEMPWYRPGNLTNKDSWSVTAHILQMNQMNVHGDLNAVTAAQIHLH